MCPVFPWTSGLPSGAETSLPWAHICTTTHVHLTHITPSHPQTFSRALHAVPPFKPPLPFPVPEDSPLFSINTGLHPASSERPFCSCSGLLLLPSNWSNSGIGNFVCTDRRCCRYKTLSSSVPANMIARLYGCAFQPQMLVHNTLPLVTTCSSKTPTYYKAHQFSRTPREGNVFQYKTAFLLPWKSWPNKHFASSFAMEEIKLKPGSMHDASCMVSPTHFLPSIRLLCSHDFQHPE